MSEKALVGVAGVHFVVGELSRRGWVALPTIRNTKGIDVLATNEDRSIQIQVKSRANSRRFVLHRNAEEFHGDSLYYIFVNLMAEDSPEYFVIPSKVVAEYVAHTHKLFLAAGGRDSNMRSLPNAYGPDLNLETYKNKWEVLKSK